MNEIQEKYQSYAKTLFTNNVQDYNKKENQTEQIRGAKWSCDLLQYLNLREDEKRQTVVGPGVVCQKKVK